MRSKKKDKNQAITDDEPKYPPFFYSDDTDEVPQKRNSIRKKLSKNERDIQFKDVYTFNEVFEDLEEKEDINFKEIVKNVKDDIVDYNEIYNRKYDQVCWLAAHNAFSSLKYRWIYHQQSITYDDMFDMGVRGFLIDVHWYEYGSDCNGTKSREIALMHSPNKFYNVVLQRQGPPPRLTTFLEKIKEWLYQHPNEIISIFFESYTGKDGEKEMEKLFKEYDIWDDLYIHQYGTEWPTIGELIEDDTRLVVFTNNHNEPFNSAINIVRNHWDYRQYPDGKMIIGNKNGKNTIFRFSHHHPVSLDIIRSYTKFNSFENIMRRANNSMNETGKIPNFVGLDFVQKGDGMKAVNVFNKMFENFNNGLPRQLSSKLEN